MSDRRTREKCLTLPTQQRRLRHLRSVAARNVLLQSEDTQQPLGDMEIFFSLYQSSTSKAFYTSEKIQGSMNPTWRSFNLDHMALEGVNTANTAFILRVWRGIQHQYHLCMEWNVDLRGLKYSGDKLLGQSVQYPPNAIIFGMFDGFYVAPTKSADSASGSPVSSSTSLAPAATTIEIEAGSTRKSFSVGTLLRIQTILRATKQTQQSVARVRRDIEDKLHHSHNLHNKKCSHEVCLLRVGMCRKELEWRMNKLQQEKEEHDSLQVTNHKRDTWLKSRFESLHKDKVRLHEKKKSYFDVREELIKSGAQLVMRRKQLISELTFIYPIVELPNNVYTIAGARLPNSEDFAGENETMIEVGLGNTCHLVLMMSHFLDVPPRYPMVHRCSRSQIRDHIMEKLTDKDRDFPLYTKGKERFQFNYGVYLINKNIAQLRYYCGLGTSDLRLTLPNLKSLLELRLGVKFETSPGPLNAMANQHLSIPPNLGGPQRLTSPSFTSQKQQGPQNKHSQSQEALNQHKTISASSKQENGKVMPNDEALLKQGDERRSLISVDIENDRKLYEQSRSVSPDKSSNHGKLSLAAVVGTAALYDDVETSSSADSTNMPTFTTTGSKFKTWSKVQEVDAATNDPAKKPKEIVASAAPPNASKFKMWSKDSNHGSSKNGVTVGKLDDALNDCVGIVHQAEELEEEEEEEDSEGFQALKRLTSLDEVATTDEVTFDLQKQAQTLVHSTGLYKKEKGGLDPEEDRSEDIGDAGERGAVSWGNDSSSEVLDS